MFIAEVSGFKKQLASSIQDRAQDVSLAEAEYVRRPTEEGLWTFQEKMRAYREALTDQTTKLRLAQSRCIFKFGDKNSRVLASLVKPDYVPTYMSVYDQRREGVDNFVGIL